ncbi:MAG: lytic transglycosylase domain-containing protein [Methylophilaceae bacterium]|jgi:soluble lytic murein transglycosylase-like protein|nr:MAG: lytic transglycosylase domain-containing protein [Methylophilaceae bacterium]
MIKQLLLIGLLFWAMQLEAGEQKEEALSNSVKAVMQKSVTDVAAPRLMFADPVEGQAWLTEMSQRLQKKLPDKAYREDFLISVHYEATRAGLDPQLVLALIQVESAFKKYAVSSAGARGYMQVMPFWVQSIGSSDHNLFNLRLNLRYGCTILRHYLDIERGNLFRALGRYNGSLGREKYPNLVIDKQRKYWDYKGNLDKSS